MEKRNMKQHVSFVGALHIGFGLLGIAGAMAIFFGFQFLFELVEHEPIAQKVLTYVGNSLALIMLFFSTLGVIGGMGLFSYRSWARILVMIVSALNCLNVPVGTAKGIYSLWVLMQPETIELFENSNQS
ncbi:MAG: hypothetical protein GQ579_03850 [Bacteroidales bacterium]|jgi:hypothetical protein|nr:hypothetical protein [Bacteroidales bacterium]